MTIALVQLFTTQICLTMSFCIRGVFTGESLGAPVGRICTGRQWRHILGYWATCRHIAICWCQISDTARWFRKHLDVMHTANCSVKTMCQNLMLPFALSRIYTHHCKKIIFQSVWQRWSRVRSWTGQWLRLLPSARCCIKVHISTIYRNIALSFDVCSYYINLQICNAVYEISQHPLLNCYVMLRLVFQATMSELAVRTSVVARSVTGTPCLWIRKQMRYTCLLIIWYLTKKAFTRYNSNCCQSIRLFLYVRC